MKIKRVVKFKEDIVDLQGLTIKKGTKVGIETVGPKRPGGGRVAVCRVDNGSGDWSLCPQTAIVINKGE